MFNFFTNSANRLTCCLQHIFPCPESGRTSGKSYSVSGRIPVPDIHKAKIFAGYKKGRIIWPDIRWFLHQFNWSLLSISLPQFRPCWWQPSLPRVPGQAHWGRKWRRLNKKFLQCQIPHEIPPTNQNRGTSIVLTSAVDPNTVHWI